MFRHSSVRSNDQKRQTDKKNLLQDEEEQQQYRLGEEEEYTGSKDYTNDNTLVATTTILGGEPSSPSPSDRLLSPHHSILQALNNPDLELSIDNNTNPRFYTNNEFSMTSWQSISCFQDLNPRVNNVSNANSNKNLITMSKSPSYDSPYIGSVLSSSDNEDRERDETDLSHAHQVLIFNSDSDTENELTDDDDYDQLTNTDSDLNNNNKTGNSLPSFVMPRISVSSSTSQKDFLNDSLLSVQVIGHSKELLINRLSDYKKSLKNIRFTNKNPQLIILIVNSDNYVLPNLLHKPFIPIFVESAGTSESISTEDDISSRVLFKSSMICEPLKLKSFDDDLMDLIEFLSNLSPTSFKWIINDINDRLVQSVPLDKHENPLSLSQANSLFIKKTAKLRRKSTSDLEEEPDMVLNKRRKSTNSVSVSHYYDHVTEASKMSKSSEKKKCCTDKDDSDKRNKDYDELKEKLIYGITIGMVSLTMIYIWKEVIFSNNSSTMTKVRLSDSIISATDLNSHATSTSNPIQDSLNPIIELVLGEIDDFRRFTISSSFDMINRVKFTLRQLLDFTSELISDWVS